MLKKMMLIAIAAGALVAFAVPAAASATILTDSSGTLKPGATVRNQHEHRDDNDHGNHELQQS